MTLTSVDTGIADPGVGYRGSASGVSAGQIGSIGKSEPFYGIVEQSLEVVWGSTISGKVEGNPKTHALGSNCTPMGPPEP